MASSPIPKAAPVREMTLSFRPTILGHGVLNRPSLLTLMFEVMRALTVSLPYRHQSKMAKQPSWQHERRCIAMHQQPVYRMEWPIEADIHSDPLNDSGSPRCTLYHRSCIRYLHVAQ